MPHSAEIHRNRANPRCEALGFSQSVDLLERLEHRLLRNVFGFSSISCPVIGQTEHSWSVSLGKAAERIPVTLDGAHNEVGCSGLIVFQIGSNDSDAEEGKFSWKVRRKVPQ